MFCLCFKAPPPPAHPASRLCPEPASRLCPVSSGLSSPAKSMRTVLQVFPGVRRHRPCANRLGPNPTPTPPTIHPQQPCLNPHRSHKLPTSKIQTNAKKDTRIALDQEACAPLPPSKKSEKEPSDSPSGKVPSRFLSYRDQGGSVKIFALALQKCLKIIPGNRTDQTCPPAGHAHCPEAPTDPHHPDILHLTSRRRSPRATFSLDVGLHRSPTHCLQSITIVVTSSPRIPRSDFNGMLTIKDATNANRV